VVGVPVSLVFGLISANITAAVMSFMGQGMKWFSNERFCLVLYTPPALLGILVFQVFLNSRASGQNLERLSYRSVHLFFSAGAWAVQGLGIGSAGLLWFVSLFTGAGIVTDWVWGDTEVPIASYVLGTVGPLVLGTEVTASLTDIFVPLVSNLTYCVYRRLII
jgi:hypothetical protein